MEAGMRGTIRTVASHVIAILGITQLAHGAELSTNFTGNWKVNVDKCNFGPLFAPKSAEVKIDHKGPALAINDQETNEQGESTTAESNFTTDGKETTGTIIAFPMEVKGTAKWMGDKLAFSANGKFNGTDVHVEEQWELSRDRATLTISRTLSAVMGTTTQTIVLEK
jgi:hypothetical protein